MFMREVSQADLVKRRDLLMDECQPDAEFRVELERSPIDAQIVALALVAGMRKVRPTRH